jgi:TPR repeat protein
MAAMKKTTRSRISPFTVNMIFEKIEDQKILRSSEGRFTFAREEKVEKVFPAQIGEYLRGLSSASYYSWFLHGQENGGRIRLQVEKLFEENPVQFVQEMAEKCRVFLCPGGEPALSPDVWKELLDELGKNNPLFVRDGDRALQLQSMSLAAPQRVLTLLLLAASMNDFSEEKYESILACWHLMDRDLAAKDYTQPHELARTGKILYTDGLRKEALESYRKAVRMLEGSIDAADADPEDRELYARLQYYIGAMVLHGDGCTADEESAAVCMEESAGYGYVPAYHPLAMLLVQSGKGEKAVEILRKGAEEKDHACLRMLGNACYTGDSLPGVEKDLNEAARCYLEGACAENLSEGDAQCQYMLGRILEESGNGQGGPVPAVLAESDLFTGPMADPAFWLETAARRGHREAAALLNRLRWGISGTGGKSSRPDRADTIQSGGSLSGAAAGLFAEEERDLPLSSSEGPAGADIEKTGKLCLLNSDHERNLYFAKTLPSGNYTVQLCSDKSMAQMLRETVAQYAASGKLQELPEILLMAMGDDEQKNMRDALEVLRMAAKLHAWTGALAADGSGSGKDTAGSGEDRADGLFYLLSDRLRLYVCGRGESCGPVLDSACTQMGDFYIPLYLCDPDQMASAWLLDRMPLFIPCLKGASSRMDTIIFGDHPGIVRLCKDAIAAAQISEIPFSLTVIGENADELQEMLLTDCPGLDNPVAGVEAAKPVFIKMRPESRRLQELLSVRPGQDWTPEEKDLSMTLQAADYIVVYTADEDRNLTLSMFLREWYLKTDPSFYRLPFIAAYCGREDRAEQFRTLSVGAEEAGFDWFNNYDIHCFGTNKQLFSYRELIHGRLEQRTRAAHLTYYGICGAEGPESGDNLRLALHDYFSRQYNRDSSGINALALNYRLFSAGITFPDWHSYLAGVSQKKLADQFGKWLRAEDEGNPGKEGADRGKGAERERLREQTADRRLEILSMQEHDRWCRSMLSRGWMPASTAQMQAYIQRGCTRHQLYLAKLHPFLCAWDQLGELKPVPTGMQRIYGYLLQQISPGKEPSDIRGIDRDNIRMTEYLVGIE